MKNDVFLSNKTDSSGSLHSELSPSFYIMTMKITAQGTAQIQNVSHRYYPLFYIQPWIHLSFFPPANLLNIVTVVKVKASAFEASLHQCLHWKDSVPHPEALLWLYESTVNNRHLSRKKAASICFYLQLAKQISYTDMQTGSCAKNVARSMSDLNTWVAPRTLMLCYVFPPSNVMQMTHDKIINR